MRILYHEENAISTKRRKERKKNHEKDPPKRVLLGKFIF